MDDYGISSSQTLSVPQTYPANAFVTPTLVPSTVLPTPAPVQHLIPRRPKKQANPNPQQISEQLARLDNELVDAFDTFADLIDTGIPLVRNETEQRFFYTRLQEFKKDFDSLIILRGGKRKTRKNKKSKSKRTKN
jgi:hypothetical protein